MVKKKESLGAIKFKSFFKKNKIFFEIIAVLAIIGGVITFVGGGDEENLVYGDDVVELTYFHLSTCPHCHKQNAFHKTLKELYPELRITEYELTNSASKQKYLEMSELYEELEPASIATPTSVIGKRVNIGYGSDETTGQVLIEMIEEERLRIESEWTQDKVRTLDLRAQQQ